MQRQLSIFELIAPRIEEIYDFLIKNYPELKFKIEDQKITQTLNKKISLWFEIVHRNEYIDGFMEDIWCRRNNYFISIRLQKNYGDFEGYGISSDTLEEFKTDVRKAIDKFRAM